MKWVAALTPVLMALLGLAAIVYAAGKNDGDVLARLTAIESRLTSIERSLTNRR